MKKLITLALASLCVSAFAGTNADAGATAVVTSNPTSTSSSQSAATNAGNSQTTVFNSPANTTSTVTSTSTATVNQNVSGSTSTSNVNVNSISGTTTQNNVISGGTDSSERVWGTQTIKNTPSVNGPPLVSSNDTCMGSASGSANVPGFGLSLGKTYTDSNCVMLKNARELWNMGMKGAAMARMCMDAENREALEMTGFTCPQTLRARGQAYNSASLTTTTTTTAAEPQASGTEYTGNDPIVRRRLGLPVKE